MASPSDPTHTHRLADLDAAAHEALRRRAAPRTSLLVYHEAGVEAAVLTEGKTLWIGRHAPGGLSILDPSLSRRHASFTLSSGGRIHVQDAGSTNGIWVAGKRVSAAEIGPGDELVLGNVLVVVRLVVSGSRVDRPVHEPPAGDAPPIATSPSMRALFAMADRVAGSSVPVIVRGETGTGKEVLARYLHDRSPRRSAPLVSVNCAAIPPQLVESTLFGHEKGAFTGAGQRQKGVFEEAEGGTVFLDEIGELPAAAQAALLRVLETRRFTRIGSVKEVSADVRVIAATHRDLDQMCREGTFRSDLHFRLNTIVLTIPPLRDRRDDIAPLAERFLLKAAEGRSLALSEEARIALARHAWPGNVRELRNTVEHAALFANGDQIGVMDLPASIREAPMDEVAPASFSAPPASYSAPPASFPPPPLPPNISSPARTDAPPTDLRAHLEAYEAQLIAETLDATGWNQSEAARRLGLPIRTLANKVKSFGLKRPVR